MGFSLDLYWMIVGFSLDTRFMFIGCSFYAYLMPIQCSLNLCGRLVIEWSLVVVGYALDAQVVLLDFRLMSIDFWLDSNRMFSDSR